MNLGLGSGKRWGKKTEKIFLKEDSIGWKGGRSGSGGEEGGGEKEGGEGGGGGGRVRSDKGGNN
jgi:hypothetical protein